MDKADEILLHLEKRLELLESGKKIYGSNGNEERCLDISSRVDELKDIIGTVEYIILKD